ncbi:MAG: family 20 glycosylhydrolase [Victivallales bacterium]
MYKSIGILPSVAKSSGNGKDGMQKRRLNVVHVPGQHMVSAQKWTKELSGFYGFRKMNVAAASEKDGCWIVISDQARKCDIPSVPGAPAAESYKLRSSQNGIHIRANDRNGLLYGLTSAFQILAGEGDCVPVSMIEDAPLYPFRSFQLDLARQPETLDTIRKWIVRLAMFKMNRMGLYLEDAYAYRACPGIAPKGALDAESYREIEEFGRLWGVEVYPMMNCYGHMGNFLRHKKYRHLSEGREGKAARPWIGNASGTICHSLPEAKEFLRSMILEWGEVSSSGLLHVGMDECWNFASCPLCRKKARKDGDGKVFLDHLLFLRETALEAGKKIGIWNDIVYWFPEIIRDIPKDVVLFDWEYSHVPSRRRYCELNHMATDSAKWLVEENGFQMVASPATNIENIQSYRRYCDPYRIQGFHFTTWELSHKFLEECLPGFAYGAEASWARSPVSIDNFPERFSKIWFGTTDEKVAAIVDASLPNYSDQGHDISDPATLIRHEVSEESFKTSRKLHHDLLAISSSDVQVKRNEFTLRAMRLNMARSSYSAKLELVINETAVAIRQLLNRPEAVHILDSLSDRLSELKSLRLELADNINEFDEVWKLERGTIPMLHHAGTLAGMPVKLDDFINAIQTFIKNPRLEPVRPGKYWVAIDYAEIDANYRSVLIEGSDDMRKWSHLVATRDCGSNAYREVAPLKIRKPVRYLKLTVSRVGASAIKNIRLVGWKDEWFPSRVVSSEGKVLCAEHLLRDDSRAAIMGEADTWLAYHNPDKTAEKSSVVLEMKPYVQYPRQMK